MASDPSRGDKVSWKSSQGEIKGHVVAASDEDPEYLVRSEKTGAVAAHKPDALKKR